MILDAIHTYFSINSGLLKSNLKEAIKTAEVEAIHNMRVSIKRLNTLLLLLNSGKTPYLRLNGNFDYLKAIFKSSGYLRDLQVMQNLVINHEHFSVNPGFEQFLSILKREENTAIKKFNSFSESIDLLKLSRILNLIHFHIANLQENGLDETIQRLKWKQFKKLRNFSNSNSQKYNLHSARKVIKKLVYIAEMTAGNDALQDNQQKLLKEAGRCLGEWHDRLVFCNFLQSLNKQNLKVEIEFKSVLNDLFLEKNVIKEEYIRLLAEIMQPEVLLISSTR
ncbi:MAG: CHAD domain-containing protein [Bacteroidales bacterium]